MVNYFSNKLSQFFSPIVRGRSSVRTINCWFLFSTSVTSFQELHLLSIYLVEGDVDKTCKGDVVISFIPLRRKHRQLGWNIMRIFSNANRENPCRQLRRPIAISWKCRNVPCGMTSCALRVRQTERTKEKRGTGNLDPTSEDFSIIYTQRPRAPLFIIIQGWSRWVPRNGSPYVRGLLHVQG